MNFSKRLTRFLVFLIFFASAIFSVHADENSFNGAISQPLQPTQTKSAAQLLTLRDCYRLALKQSETMAIHKEEIKEAEARFLQALSGVLPKVDFVYSDKRQDGNDSGNFTLTQIPEQKFTLSQPLFSGFKEFASIAGSKAERRQKEYQEIRAEELLFADVVDAFYLFLGYQQEYDAVIKIREALAERVEELKKREELGRSRLSEVMSVESRLRRSEADLEFIQSEYEIARQMLEFLTGIQIVFVKDDGEEAYLAVTAQEIFDKARERKDVLAAKESWEISKKNISVAAAGFLPSVNLDGNYYTKRVGSSAGVDWDITLKAEVPLFDGTENIGKLKEAKALSREEELRYQESKRKAALEIQSAFTSWDSSVRRLAAVQKALEAAEKNYEFQKQDYQHNLVSNLEVLQALEETEDMRRSFINVEKETRRAYWHLQSALGEIRL